jgi:hypothetical protein
MFPNVRLMVVAILAAITGIGCGLGLFATFRVNHEPLARLAEGGPPLQLAFDNRALGSDTRAPMEARLSANGAARVISVPVIIATPNLAPNPEPNPEQSPAPSPTPSAEPTAERSTEPTAGSSAETNPAPERSGADSTTAVESGVQQAAIGAAAEDQSTSASRAVAVAAELSSVSPEAIAPGQQEAVAAVPDPQPAAAATTAPPAEQTAAIDAVEEIRQPEIKPIESGERKAAKPAARATRAVPAHRVAKTVRVHRTVAAVAAQPTYQYPQPTSQPTYPPTAYSQTAYSQTAYSQTAYSQTAYSQTAYSKTAYSQPTYSWADGTVQASQAVKRIQIKRHRTARKAPPAAQSNVPATTAGLSGTQ